MRAISCTRVFVSRASVCFERNCESFAWRQGCWEMCTLVGREVGMVSSCEWGIRTGARRRARYIGSQDVGNEAVFYHTLRYLR